MFHLRAATPTMVSLYISQRGVLLGAAAACQGGREHMEDEHVLLVPLGGGAEGSPQRVYLSAVFDGHAGKEVAQFLRRRICETFLRTEGWHWWVERGGGSDSVPQLREALRETILSLDACVLSSPYMHTAGSTAVVVLLTETHILCANVGDSRATLIRFPSQEQQQQQLPPPPPPPPSSSPGADWALLRRGLVPSSSSFRWMLQNCVETADLSRDHKPNLPDERDRIRRAGGFVHDNRVDGILAMSRALGDSVFKRNREVQWFEQRVVATPDISVVPRRHDDDCAVMIASDGVWDLFPNSRAAARSWMARLAATNGDSESVTLAAVSRATADFVRDCAVTGGAAADNITAVVIFFSKEEEEEEDDDDRSERDVGAGL